MLGRRKIRAEGAKQTRQEAHRERLKPSAHLLEADIEKMRHQDALEEGRVWRLPWEPILAEKLAADNVDAFEGVVRGELRNFACCFLFERMIFALKDLDYFLTSEALLYNGSKV